MGLFRFVALLVCAPLFLLASLAAHAQILSLEEALAIALANNTSVTNAELQREAAKDDVQALRTARYPRLDVNGRVSHHLEDQEYIFEEGVWGDYPVIGEVPAQDITIKSNSGTTQQVSAGITQPLAQQYRLGLSIEQGEVREDMATEFVRLTQQDVARVVKEEYFNILQSQSTLATTREAIVFYTSLVELVSNYVSQRIAFEYELLETQARLARRELEANSQMNRLSTQKERMNTLLSRDINTPFRVSELPAEVLVTGGLDDAVETAMSQRPEVRESELKVKDAELGYDIKQAEYLPDLDLSLRYTRLYDTALIPDTEAYVGLRARWEIFDWGRKKSELASKNARIQSAENSARNLKDRVAIDVRRSFRSIAEAEQAVEVARLSQAAARDKLRVLMNQYKQQATLLQNVLDAESDLDRANNAYNRAVLSVYRAQAELERAVGDI
ncbi:MAG: TolC family protein [Pseudomonadota bacterium]